MDQRKNKMKRKTITLLASLVLVFALLVGTTVAYIITKDDPLTNTFTPSRVSCSVEETFQNNTKTNVKIKNTGDTEAYIRAAIVITWKDAANGNVYGQTPVADRDYSITLNNTNWIKGSDGYYYCKSPVAPDQSTAVLINSCSPISGKAPAGYGLNVEILGSAIQSVPISVVNQEWPAVHANAEHGDLSAK